MLPLIYKLFRQKKKLQIILSNRSKIKIKIKYLVQEQMPLKALTKVKYSYKLDKWTLI